jgi:hypothetical protein
MNWRDCQIKLADLEKPELRRGGLADRFWGHHELRLERGERIGSADA